MTKVAIFLFLIQQVYIRYWQQSANTWVQWCRSGPASWSGIFCTWFESSDVSWSTWSNSFSLRWKNSADPTCSFESHTIYFAYKWMYGIEQMQMIIWRKSVLGVFFCNLRRTYKGFLLCKCSIRCIVKYYSSCRSTREWSFLKVRPIS